MFQFQKAKEKHKACQNHIVYFYENALLILNLVFSFFVICFHQYKMLWVHQVKIYINFEV
jgi:hypothetical protein